MPWFVKGIIHQSLWTELGVTNNNHSLTYTKVDNSTPSDVVAKNIGDLNKLGFSDIPDENKCLPKIYLIPKNYKTPIKERFIVASPVCSIKPLAKSLTSLFRVFFKQIETYNAKCRFFSGVNTFWVVQNNKTVTDAIKNWMQEVKEHLFQLDSTQ